MDKLTIPALFTVDSSQPDSRQLAITINTVFEGACFGKYLFSLDAVNAAAPDIQNIPILSEDGSCAVGLIPETTDSRWTKVLVDGIWRKYLQLAALLWVKLDERLPDIANNKTKFHEIELDLTEIDAELQENGIYAVSDFKISGCRLTDKKAAATFTATSRYGNLPIR